MPESEPQIEDIAAEWAVKTDAGPLEAGEQAALDAWLDAETRHLGAFARARAALAFASADRLAGTQDLRKWVSQPPAHSRRKFVMAAAGMAACGAGAILAAPWMLSQPEGQSYSTRIGETQIVPLADGSIITLNTNSKVLVDYTNNRRDISLLQGEALFDVAKNRQRPFFVLAGGAEARAVGTSFAVRSLPGQAVQVLVREGIVEVKRPDTPVAPPVRLAANMRAIVPADAPIRVEPMTPDEVARLLAWREGRIAFEGETLKEAAAEFARYSNTHIVIDAPGMENRTVAGLFVANDPVGFSEAVAASFKLRMEVSDHEIRLSR
jgi:transmembrane sensor